MGWQVHIAAETAGPRGGFRRHDGVGDGKDEIEESFPRHLPWAGGAGDLDGLERWAVKNSILDVFWDMIRGRATSRALRLLLPFIALE